MLRDLLGVLTAAAAAVAVGAGLIFAVTIGALFLPSGVGPAAVVAACAWAVLVAAVLGVGPLFILSRVFSGGIAPRPAAASGVLGIDPAVVRTAGRCPVCRTGGVRRGLVWCGRCLTPHHEDCWRYAGKCALFGCGGTVSRIAR